MAYCPFLLVRFKGTAFFMNLLPVLVNRGAEIEDYCIALGDTLSDMELTTEDALDEEEQRLIRQPNGKVRWIIHRLKRAGWLDTEYRDGTFEEVVAPRDYADQMIRLLLELEQSETKEYNSLVFSTYSGLKQAYEEKSDRMYEALLTARRNTAELLQDLKSLYHNIRYYHQIIGQAVDVNQLLHDYYDEYKGMLDRIYHPIKTMDSLPHYRQPILDILNALLVDDEIMERAVGRMVQLHPDEEPAEARRTLDGYIQELLSSYSNVEDILRQIDRKHRAYGKPHGPRHRAGYLQQTGTERLENQLHGGPFSVPPGYWRD